MSNKSAKLRDDDFGNLSWAGEPINTLTRKMAECWC